LRRGQYLKVSVRTQSQSGALFTDLFKVPTDSLQPAMRVDEASFTEQVLPIDSIGADPQNFRLRNLLRELRLEVKEDGFYLLRLQPELLRGGRYEISVQLSASLAFPVSGGTAKSVRSFFGDARDGGRRKHEGIDIFAARHTPILAATDGEVNFVGENTLGGKVVWQYDRRRQVGIYYAHLDTQFVVANTYAKMGDTLGLMGNTGNARTTPPHLHFGVYAKGGAVDPYPFVYESYPPPPVVTPDGERLAGRLGEWVHTVGTALLLVSTDKKSLAMSTLPKHLPLTIVGSHDKHYRALLPDGRTGYVAMKSLSDKPLRAQTLPRGERLYQTPEREAAVIDSLAGGTPVSVLGSFDAFLYIQTPKGQRGWLAPAN
ncbi:MAG: M23 family metallopeptidase, partial [Rhizobacter sp.]|nr:M23 family metallopeptidase [Chlorobiales bacterium]